MGGRQRGELTPLNKRIKLVELIREAHQNGARLDKACEVAVLSKRTYRRWYKAGKVLADLRATAVRPEPANKLTEYERQQVLARCNEERFSSSPPRRSCRHCSTKVFISHRNQRITEYLKRTN